MRRDLLLRHQTSTFPAQVWVRAMGELDREELAMEL
jgi:hypothetical protein